jgi:hypothetical protein
MNVLAQNDPRFASGYLRIHLPALHLLDDFNVIPLQSPVIPADYYDWADVIWHQTPMDYSTATFLKHQGKKVLDCDDIIELGGPEAWESPQEKQYKINIFNDNFKHSNKVILGNQFMADFYKDRIKDPIIMGEYLDPCTHKWNNTKKNDGKFRIVWAGAKCYNHDIKEIQDLFKKVHDKYPQVEFIFIGFGKEFECDYIKHINFVHYKEFPKFLAEVGADLAINHLSDRELNKAKTNIKWLEYSWIGIPSLLSERFYKNMIPNDMATFCKGTDEYLEAIGRIIKDGTDTGDKAQKYVQDKYNLHNHLEEYKNVINLTYKS